MSEATRFCVAAGFDVERYSDDFAFVHLNEQSVFDLDRIDGLDPATQSCRLLHHHRRRGRLARRGSPSPGCGHIIEDMPWGMHEFTLTDPSGNNIRIGRSTSDEVSR